MANLLNSGGNAEAKITVDRPTVSEALAHSSMRGTVNVFNSVFWRVGLLIR